MTWITTNSGKRFDFTQPFDNTFDIHDIAHALAHINRFTGHTDQPYSVAQHSVYVSNIVPPRYALAGLMHDAAEAYLGDVSAPLKALLPEYKRIEHEVEMALCRQRRDPPVHQGRRPPHVGDREARPRELRRRLAGAGRHHAD